MGALLDFNASNHIYDNRPLLFSTLYSPNHLPTITLANGLCTLVGRTRRDDNKEKNHNEASQAYKNSIVCYEYKKQGHVKAEYSLLKRQPQKKFFRKKNRSMMSTWEDLDESSIESEEVKEEANFRLIAYANLDNEVKYELEQLHDAYDELVEESNCLSNLDISLFSTLAPKEVRT